MLLASCLVLLTVAILDCQGLIQGNDTASIPVPMCNGSTSVYGYYETGHSPEDENQYKVTIQGKFTVVSFIEFELDGPAGVRLKDRSYARISLPFENLFYISFYRQHSGIELIIKGATEGKFSYFKTIKINTDEICPQPVTGVFDSYIKGYRDFTSLYRNRTLYAANSTCGRRQIDHVELIVNGQNTKPGDWPWHVAIYRMFKSAFKYICGGTLISNVFVLTAGHCVTIRARTVAPNTLSVVLGKYNLVGGDMGSEERQVVKVIVHKQFEYRYLDNDIALIKLQSEIAFTDYIQPACLWEKETVNGLPPGDVHGMIVGWGFDQKEKLSSQLQMALLPIVPDIECIRTNYVFYGKVLNGNKFCAGYRNGTSPCNGDSGGGFVVFIPDSNDSKNPTGSWYIRGITSSTVTRVDVALCDPNQNAVFTDIAVYKDWVNQNMAENI